MPARVTCAPRRASWWPITLTFLKSLWWVLLGLVAAALLRAQPVPVVAAPVEVLQLEPFKVTGTRVTASDVGGPNPVDRYDESDVENSGAFDLGEFLDQLPPGVAGTEQLVLIDGQPTYLDIRKLPLEMIAGIEVANYGGMPQHGAYSNGRVINITLKKDYRGGNIGLFQRGSLAGGGEQSGISFSGSATQGKARIFFSVNFRQREALYASERSFSRDQNRIAQGGTDLRLPWGSPAVVQAVTGPLNGVFDANGQPLSVALVPETFTAGTLQPGDFLPGQLFAGQSVPLAAGQRRFNTADTLALASPSHERSADVNFSYPLTARVQLAVTGSVDNSYSDRISAPPVTPVSADTVVPAALNPFGQDVAVGLVHTGFGPVLRRSDTTSARFGVTLSGRFFGERWKWNSTAGTRWSDATQRVTDLDREKFSAALAAVDPAQRFDPFGPDSRNAALYPQLAVERTNANRSLNSRLELSASGPVFTAPGGASTLALRGNYSDQLQERSYRNALGESDAVIKRHPNSYALTGTLNVPWIEKARARPALQRLDTEFATNFSDRSSAGAAQDQRFGVSWAPLKSLLLRGSLATARLAPVQFLAEAQPLVTETFIDPRRTPNSADEVQLITRDFDGVSRGRTEQLVLGASFDPPAIPGLQLTVNYDRQERKNLTASSLEAQDLIYNELALADRVTRAAPTANDLALNQPGAILAVDTTPIEGGAQSSSGLAFTVEYRVPSEQLGQFRLSASARHPLASTYEIRPGVPFVFEDDSSANPPEWTARSQFSWSHHGWQISTNIRYTDEVIAKTFVTPATTELDVRFGYRFRAALWNGWGRGLQVAVGLGNLTQGEPPFANTLTGFRGGSALGRTYSLTLRLPLGASRRERS